MSEKKTTIGGQAVIEGIVMKGPEKSALAVRNKSGEITVEYLPFGSLRRKYKPLGLPIIRGVVTFVESLVQGYKSITLSAERSGYLDDEEEPEKKTSGAFMNAIMTIGMILGILLGVVLFMYIPALLFNLLNRATGEAITTFRSLFEGFIKLIVFVAYMYGVSKMKDIHRVFQYHGAEHKTIFAYEAGLELTVENCRRMKRFHPRCGTSFMILMLLVSIIISGVISIIFPAFAARTALWVCIKILLLPVICGLGYEIIRINGRHDNVCTRVLAAPGMWLQRISTQEPDDGMLEVAIEALRSVIPDDPDSDRW